MGSKAVYSIDSGAIFTCQYPDLRSNVEKYHECERMSMESSILGRGRGYNGKYLIKFFKFRLF